LAAQKRVIVAGAGGVFGSLLVRELAPDFDVVAATRKTLDLGKPEQVEHAARGAFAIACTAGPFQRLDPRIVRAAVSQGAHWLDIADDRRWFFDLLDDRELDAMARARGVAVIPGLSTLPAISGALVRRLNSSAPVDITLSIGNANRKGPAAIASAAAFDPVDPELLRRELGIDARVHFKLELPGAAAMLRVFGKLPRLSARLARPFRFGTSGGAVEVRSGDRRERVSGADQRMAILPLVFALGHLEGLAGCLSPSVFDAEELLRFVG
jgi:hypothetical protein